MEVCGFEVLEVEICGNGKRAWKMLWGSGFGKFLYAVMFSEWVVARAVLW